MTMMDTFTVQAIWTAVLVQVVRDLTRPGQHQTGETAMAERWIGTYASRDFRDVCTLAGLEPSASHAWFRRLCDTPFEERRALVRAFEATLETLLKKPSGTTARAVQVRAKELAA